MPEGGGNGESFGNRFFKSGDFTGNGIKPKGTFKIPFLFEMNKNRFVVFKINQLGITYAAGYRAESDIGFEKTSEIDLICQCLQMTNLICHGTI